MMTRQSHESYVCSLMFSFDCCQAFLHSHHIFQAILLMNRLITEGLEAHLLSSTRLVSLQRIGTP